MTQLALPAVELHASWAACVSEFSPGTMHGSGHWNLPDGLEQDTDRDTCEALVALLRRLGRETDGKRVPSDYWWLVDRDDVVGFLAIRHRLNDDLRKSGGHIGYSVRPSRRREGHASRALKLGLIRARELGIREVLLTCDVDNLASRRTIEANGGVLEDERADEFRYWVTT